MEDRDDEEEVTQVRAFATCSCGLDVDVKTSNHGTIAKAEDNDVDRTRD